MNNADDMVWDVLKRSFCKFRVMQRINEKTFCKCRYNLTGFCKARLCPLANSQYATVLERNGKLFLKVKTPERAHLPAKWWDSVLLSNNLVEAMRQIDENLQWWPRNIIFKCKARVMRIREYLSRMRYLRLHPGPTSKLVHIKKKEEKMLYSREHKAERIAMLDQSIEKELLNRLRTGAYDSEIPVNIPDTAFMAVVDKELDREDAMAAQEKEDVQERATEGLYEADLGTDMADFTQELEGGGLEDIEDFGNDNDDLGEEDDDDGEGGGARISSKKKKRKHTPIGKEPKKPKRQQQDRQQIFEHEIEGAVRTLFEW